MTSSASSSVLTMAENLGALDVEAGGAGEMDLVAGVHADHADILAGRLGAVARAARHRHLDLGRRPRAPHELLDPDAEAGRILRAEAAPVGADAGLHRAQALGVGVAGDEAGLAEIGPDGRQVLLPDAQHVDALAAGDLDGRDVELVDDVGDGAQLLRRGHAAPHARHDRIGAVLLDVGVDALVDEARLVVVGIFVRPVGRRGSS